MTVGAALLTSLALAVTWTPTLSHYLLRRRPSDSGTAAAPVEHEEVATTGLMGAATRAYERSLKFVVAYPFVLALGSVGLIVASYFCYRSLGTDLLPAMDEGGFILDYLMPAGSSLADTNKVLLGVEKILAETPEVERTSRRTGLQLGLAAVTEANNGDFTVRLKAKRTRDIEEVIKEIRGKVNKRYPQLDPEFIQVLQDQIGDLTNSPEPIEIKLFASDPALLKQYGPKVAERIKKLKGVTDVKDGIENTISGAAIVMKVDPVLAARSGFTPQEIELDASALLQGEPASTQLISNDRAYTIRVRFPDSARLTVDRLRNAMITSSSTGKTASLGTLAEFQTEVGQTEIKRENLQRFVAVTGRFEGVSLGKGIEMIQAEIKELDLPPEIRVVYGGTYEEQQKSFRDLLLVLSLAIVLVFTVLLFEFREFSAPTAIVLSALLSTSGVFLALLVTGKTFNISSFMGLIMVIGIVAKNGILLLDADQRYRKQGFVPSEAMIKAGERRLRPILMTALATIAGMIPLSLAIGAGSQMLQPLAIAVIGGLLASMIVSLIVTPAVHYFLSHGKS
jgi:multidrug efflux pump subunit AcrB